MLRYISERAQLLRAYSTGIGKPAVIYPTAFLYSVGVGEVLLGLVFAAVAHLLWVFLQAMLGGQWSAWWAASKQAMALSLYTALVCPLGCHLLERVQRWLMAAPAGRARRAGR